MKACKDIVVVPGEKVGVMIPKMSRALHDGVPCCSKLKPIKLRLKVCCFNKEVKRSR